MQATLKTCVFNRLKYLTDSNIKLGFVRNRTRINDPKPRPSHYLRRKLEVATLPLYGPDDTPQYFKCEMTKKYDHEMNYNVSNNVPFDLSEITYENFLARETIKSFNNCKTICFFHTLPFPQRGMFQLQIFLRKNNFYLKSSNYKVMRKAFVGTKYHKILPLFQVNTSIVFKDDLDLLGLQNLMSSFKNLISIGGMILGEFVSASDLESLIELNDLETIQGLLSNSIAHIPATFCNIVEQPMSQLSNILNQRINMAS